MDLRGKRTLVTGASSGIGTELARKLAVAGAELIVSARRTAELERLAEELRAHGGNVEVVAADLATTEGAEALVARVGEVDVLVNNAGVEVAGQPWREGFADEGDRMMFVNVLSPLRLASKLMGKMVERGEGALVFVASVAAWAPFPEGSYYAASKAALAMAAESFRIDLKGSGVLSMCVYAGPIRTAMLDKATAESEAVRAFFARLPTGRADELATRVVDALRAGEETVVYPAIYQGSRMFEGVTRWVTRQMAPALRKR